MIGTNFLSIGNLSRYLLRFFFIQPSPRNIPAIHPTSEIKTFFLSSFSDVKTFKALDAQIKVLTFSLANLTPLVIAF